ncbi:amino acid-binding ACT protein [Gordonia iterans]|uniref:Amino acid-binding ACT protein n=1 Tax=Gordonia iterans TaxID=1004901 RepID=A0A2S0KBD3_9ACTN|nr:ACT domain-containing protein [Gordonia iterans]AVL98965.1 amino acid-binding ACT protein [Gordonia iterans]
MRNLVLSVIGDDRPGLVSALADVVAVQGGNWEQSQLAQLAGKFAGIVVVAVPEARADGLIAAVTGLDGLLEVAVHTGGTAGSGVEATPLTIQVLGTDRAGIVQELSAALSRHDVSIERLTTGTREAPMAGGTLFEAQLDVLVPEVADLSGIRSSLEAIAAELMVDLGIAGA